MKANAATGGWDAGATGASRMGADAILALRHRAFGFGRADLVIELSLAVAGPIGAFLLCWGRVQAVILVAAVLIPTPALLSLVSFRRRFRWPAQDVLVWMDRLAASEWRERTDSRMPRDPAQAGEWLRCHAESGVPLDSWVSALLLAGRVEEGRDCIGRLPSGTPRQVHRRLDLELMADAAGGLAVASAAADQAVSCDPTATPAERAAHLAYHASVAAVSRRVDGLPGLAAARPGLGRLGPGLALRLWLIRLRFAALSTLIGAWLLLAVLVGLATAGGVVWF